MLASMRSLAVLALVFATGVAACGGGSTASTEPSRSWSGPQRPYPADGVLPVEGFRAHAAGLDAEWEHDPLALAEEFLQVDTSTPAGPEEPTTTVTQVGSEVTVTREGLADDSVRAERYVLEVERDDDVWSLVSARWEQRCQQLRGHQEFSPALCV